MTAALLSLSGCGWFESPSEQQTMSASTQEYNRTLQNRTVTLAEVLAQQIKSNTPATAKLTYIYANDPDYERKHRAWSVIDQGIRTTGRDHPVSDVSASVGETRGQYILASAAQQIEPSIESALTRADQAAATATPEKKQKIEALKADISGLYADMDSARETLARTMGLTNAGDIVLAPGDFSIAAEPLPPMAVPVADLEVLALRARAELQHAAGVTQDDILSLRERTMQAFPGIGSVLTRNASGQIDLDNDEWVRFSESLTQSLTRLFTLPLNLQNPQTQAKMTALREQALSAAIMAQVHVAYDDYTASLQELNSLKDLDETQASGDTSADRAISDLNILHKTLRMNRAAADLQLAYARLLDTLGVSLVPEGAGMMDTPTLTATLESSLAHTAPDRIHGIILAAAQGHVYQPRIIPAKSIDSAAKDSGAIITAQYRPDDAQAIIPVAVNPFMKLKIPLPQKMSFRNKAGNALFDDSGAEKTTLSMDDRSVRTLLDSPITEP